MSWSIRGEYFENCNCEVLCRCITSSLAGPADNERCYVPLICHLDEGQKDGLSLDGLNVIVCGAPQVMGTDGWRVTNTLHPMGSNLAIAQGVMGRYDDVDYGFSFDNTGKFREFSWAA